MIAAIWAKNRENGRFWGFDEYPPSVFAKTPKNSVFWPFLSIFRPFWETLKNRYFWLFLKLLKNQWKITLQRKKFHSMMIKKSKKSLRSPKPRPKNRPPTLRFKKRKSLRSTSKFRPARTKYCVIWGHSLKSRYGCDLKLPHFGKKWVLRVRGPIIMPYLSIISCHFWKIFFHFF